MKTIVALLITVSLYSQSSINSASGDIVGDNGSISYSIGQVFYTTMGNGIMLYHGVQSGHNEGQLSVVKFNTLETKVYPNPATEFFVIKIPSTTGLSELEYSLVASDGRLVLRDKITSNKTTVQLEYIQRGIYILTVFTANKRIEQFKIIRR